MFETSIHDSPFQLYGEDLRCLDSGKPMMSVFHYNVSIQKTIKSIQRNLNKHIIGSQDNCLYAIKRIGTNSFIYNDNLQLHDMYEETDKTDVHEIFKLFDRTKYMYRIYASTRRKIVCIIWSHAIFDGITSQRGAYTMFGKEVVETVPMPEPSLFMRPYYVLDTMTRLRHFMWESQITRDLQTPQFHTMRLKLNAIKNAKNEFNVSFPATACAMYLQRVFKVLPQSVCRLKVFVSVYILNHNRFNNYSVVPIVVERNDCNPVTIHRSLNENKTMAYGFHELFRSNLLTNLKSSMFKPDVIFSPMKNNEDIGHVQLDKILVYNYSSSATIYACGIQTGPKYFYISSSIQTETIGAL